MKTPHKLDRTRQAAPQVFEWLRESILSLELAPGTPLSRAELAERFDLSQTPVRDALLQLSQEGLVDIFPQHATLVSRIDIVSATQAHFLRCAIELEVARTLALVDDAVLRAKLTAQVDLQAALAIADTEEFIASDQAFHRMMYEAAGVPDLYELVRRRSGHLDRLRRLDLPSPGKAERVVREHRAIVAALAAQDPGAAQSALRTHLSGTLGRIADIRARHPDYVTA
ncbi:MULTISPECIES: GntR family transcriptional regulator [Acidovorax]|uniref:DNA-binding transcriptional regulator, GntR family n=1 Tax=Acidovorax soli TaxID=592050 RepID=A0A1H3W2P4_9BURK|nr:MULTISPECIES: GntR family transcriptional regulator [Acidovorax]SDZ80608.1 DNA-binding transcriptional regulator, GntR family [Acidovorax soli]